MKSYKYLIIGGGMTADAAVRGIRDVDQEGSIGLVSAEPDPPYDRPPLSKGLWKGKPLEKIWRGTEAAHVDLHLGRRAVRLDAEGRCVDDDQGAEYGYEKVLLATGGTPRRLPFGGNDIIYFRTRQDYSRLRAAAESKRTFAVLGTGFIGSELAAALRSNGRDVVMASPDELIGQRVFPRDLAGYVTQYYREKGVSLCLRTTATGLVNQGDGYTLQLASNGAQSRQEVRADAVVAGIGIVPNTGLAQDAGAAVDNGILVNGRLETSLPDVYAAGDVASFYNSALGKWMRVEHEDNANTMGRIAGQSMAGKAVEYDYLPFFYSDLFDLGYEAVGELDSRLETFADWQEPYRKGVVYYLSAGRVRGVLLWNVWGKVDAARALIAEPGEHEPEELHGRIRD